MNKFKKKIHLFPRLLIRRTREFLRRLGLRKPADRFYVIGLSGQALMIWTAKGNIVLTSYHARRLATQLYLFADRLEMNNE
jgi:hypothetical protein